MATLSLIRRGAIFDRAVANAASLSAWLRGDWGLLFSHPDDFAYRDLEADRWTTLVQDAFAQARVRPLRLTSSTRHHEGGWITQVSDEEDSTLVLETPQHLRSDFVDMNSSNLRRAICRAPARFVMAVDASLWLRGTFCYESPDRLPSLLDFAATVSKLRAEPRDEESPVLTTPRSPSWARPATRWTSPSADRAPQRAYA